MNYPIEIIFPFVNRGNVLDGAPHGQGTMKYWDNSVSKGIWLDGVFQTD